MRHPVFLGALLVAGCGGTPEAMRSVQQTHSASMTASADGKRLFVAHPDADSVSVIDTASGRILEERRLARAAPAKDASGRYTPAVAPRFVALSSTGKTLFVSGEASGRVYALDAASAKVTTDAYVCSEPAGVVVSDDDATVFVACSADDTVVALDASDLSVVSRVPCPRKPWALAWARDGKTLLATHFLGPGVSRFATGSLSLLGTVALDDGPPAHDASAPEVDTDPTVPHGAVRGVYDAAVRPGTDELWVTHLMLGTDTPQPMLDFQSTAFPSLSLLTDSGTPLARLSVQVDPGDGGAFGDVVSGPHAVTFSDDGAYAFVADANSEDVLVVDAERRVEATLVRPLPGHLPESVVWSHGKLYVQERNTEDVAVFSVTPGDGAPSVVQVGEPFSTLAKDPMPAELRLGQKLFYSANSDDVPTTQNHWVACASCHLEGRSDAVTWQFAQGPRDTPTNAGGLLDTGFLFRTADRNAVQDYWQTIDVEQGGHFSGTEPSQKLLLDALAAYVNYAIPSPTPPSDDLSHSVRGDALSSLRARGETVFTRVGCGTCHSGDAKTDSGGGNPSLDLGGRTVTSMEDGGVLLHDVGTCATTAAWPDVDHSDIDGHARAACAFDTPQLRGLADSAPYLHDGSAASLDDVVTIMLRASTSPDAPSEPLSDDDRTALIEYLRGL
ncbi:MAG TPA: beta-propeller fold lactonase family protein [Polyangiaceae bacterium]|jgi:DNA-binding beta-propeller fold protein YncE|nr:beta-propeller fold lactonase family protein [Polyangiaceae bacterium]